MATPPQPPTLSAIRSVLYFPKQHVACDLGGLRQLRFVNQYSYLLLVIFVLPMSAVAAYFWLPRPAGLALVTLLGVVFVAATSLSRYRETHLPDTAALDGLIGKGSPVMVVLFSYY